MNARTTALSALIAIRRQNAWADGALKEYIARDRLSRRDAALAARLVYGVVQNRLLLDFDLAQVVSSPLAKLQPVVLDILRLGAYQILFLDKIPVSAAVNEAVEQTKTYANKRAAGLVNGSLRALARQKDTLAAPQDLATKYSHPQPLVDCLRASMDEETLEAFLAADNDIPKTALQCNPLIAAPEQVASALDEAQIPYEPHPWLPGCFLVSGTGNLEALPLFQSGAVYVQDPAAKLAALASGAAPGMRVLDCCAAPGGKSFAAAMQMENTGSILSCDLHPHKIALIEKNAARLGISILKAETRSAAEFDPALENGFDLVIADVPCSGLGVIRKKPSVCHCAQFAEIRFLRRRNRTGFPHAAAEHRGVQRVVRLCCMGAWRCRADWRNGAVAQTISICSQATSLTASPSLQTISTPSKQYQHPPNSINPIIIFKNIQL